MFFFFAISLSLARSPKKPDYLREKKQEEDNAGIKSRHEELLTDNGKYSVSVCVPEGASNYAVLLLLLPQAYSSPTSSTAAKLLCQNEHIVTVIHHCDEEEGVVEAADVLRAVHANAHKYGGSRERIALMGEGYAAEVVWSLLQDEEVQGFFSRAILYDVIPGLYDIETMLDTLTSLDVIVGFNGAVIEEDVVGKDLIQQTAQFIARGNEKIAKILQNFYEKRDVNAVLEDAVLFRGLMDSLDQIRYNGGKVYFCEGNKPEEKLLQALSTFIILG